MSDARTLLDAARRVLFVHAHPDDETLATGGLIAALAERGVTIAVLTASRGEQGELVPGSVPAGVDLVTHREAEVAAACRALGVRRHAFLGDPGARAAGREPRRYTDSGMVWLGQAETVAGPGASAGPDALSLADPAEVAADIAAYARDFLADLVVSYDDGGGYGHPDHVALAAPSRAAAAEVGVPFLEVASEVGAAGWTVRTPDQLGRVQQALAHHASQVTVQGADVIHVGGQRQPIQLAFTLRVPGS
ncbi:PIG-L family deacetylase [Propioniciclava soli]|uniref:PIG-L family deacetylase n=1 Tax=Propioniciclava soli TaxID=2775081 RepID=UPI001E54E3BF|nr:PIG-L family deacetylase [Propioniciclava soli]